MGGGIELDRFDPRRTNSANGPADGEFEKRVLEDLARIKFSKPPIVMMNDTRRWEMLRLVREIRHPKLDMTSFGRWTGTLLVELTGL